MELSIVTTLYRSEAHIDEFYSRMSKVAATIGVPYEIVFVDDHGPGDSLKKAIEVANADNRVSVVELAANAGHHRAMLAGLRVARGKMVFLIDVDLEEAPEGLLALWSAHHKESNVDVVYGYSEDRKGSFLARFGGLIFYGIFNKLSSIKIPRGEIVSRLMNRAYVDALLQFSEREVFIPGLWQAAGFNQVGIPLEKIQRDHATTYNMRKRIGLAVNAITSFSGKPLVYIFYMGCAMSFFSFLYIMVIVFKSLIWGISVSGWASIVASIYLIGGLMIFSLGVIGIYLSKIFVEVKARPSSIVRKIHRSL